MSYMAGNFTRIQSKLSHLMWHLYIIRCANNSLYTGITTDVARRFQEHASQGKKCAKYLRGKAPLKLVFSTKIGTKSEAARAEFRIKGLSKGEKERLVKRPFRLRAILTQLKQE